MPSSASLLHIADVHLGLGNRDSAGAEAVALERAIDVAIACDVDCIVIAGDLFDHARVSDELLAWTADQLGRAGRPVVLLPGNHDAMHTDSVHGRFRVSERAPNVALLDDPAGSLVEVGGTDFVMWGRAMIEHSPAFRPLAGVPPKPTSKWGVVVGHGLVVDGEHRRHHGSPIVPADLDLPDWDYVALGHHHGHRVVQDRPVPVVYPGATARSRAGEPGAVLVGFNPSAATTVSWISLAARSLAFGFSS